MNRRKIIPMEHERREREQIKTKSKVKENGKKRKVTEINCNLK